MRTISFFYELNFHPLVTIQQLSKLEQNKIEEAKLCNMKTWFYHIFILTLPHIRQIKPRRNESMNRSKFYYFSNTFFFRFIFWR